MPIPGWLVHVWHYVFVILSTMQPRAFSDFAEKCWVHIQTLHNWSGLCTSVDGASFQPLQRAPSRPSFSIAKARRITLLQNRAQLRTSESRRNRPGSISSKSTGYHGLLGNRLESCGHYRGPEAENLADVPGAKSLGEATPCWCFPEPCYAGPRETPGRRHLYIVRRMPARSAP